MNVIETDQQPGAEGGRTCKRCGGVWPDEGPHDCPRCHSWLIRNTKALRHGLRSRRVAEASLPELAEVRAALAEREAAIAADLGGDLTVLQADLVKRYLTAVVLGDFLAADLLQRGALTARGRARAALNAFLQVADRQHRLASALGLQRRAHHVDPFEALRAAVASANTSTGERP